MYKITHKSFQKVEQNSIPHNMQQPSLEEITEQEQSIIERFTYDIKLWPEGRVPYYISNKYS